MSASTRSLGLLQDKVVLVSGTGPGLGREIALGAAAEGASVVVGARRIEIIEAIVDEIEGLGGSALAVQTDIARPESATQLVTSAVERFGRLDVVVNNATAVEPIAPFVDTHLEAWQANFEVTVRGSLTVTQAAVPHLAAAGGAIVFVNTMVIRIPVPNLGAYAASKGALESVARILAAELGPSGIRVNSIVPGWIWGEAAREHAESQGNGTADEWYESIAAQAALRTIPTEQQVARTVLFFASPLSESVTGQTLDVNAGIYFS